MWMPPVMSRGRQAAAAAKSTPLPPIHRQSQYQRASPPPQKIPTTGKQQMAYRVFRSVQGNWGTGIML